MATRADDNGNITRYSYNGRDRLRRTTFPDNSYEQNSYDANGNRTSWRKRDGKVFTDYYDAVNLKTHTAVPSESNIYYSYDGLGRQTQVSRSGSATVSSSYDGLGRLKTSTTAGRTLTYAYDIADRRTRLTYPDGYYVTYSYDYSGALTSLKENGQTELAGYTYDSMGRMQRLDRGNGVDSTMAYDAPGRVSSFNHVGVNNASFDYNPASQLISRVVSNADFEVQLPSAGTQSYSKNALNQYTQVAGQSISYDSNGNLKSYDGWSYNYNAHNRLTSATKSGKNLALGYDASGRLYSSTYNGTQTRFLYDGDELVAEYNSSGTLLRRYVHGVGTDDPLVQYNGSGTGNKVYLLADERGSIIAELGNSQVINKYGPYGEPMNTNGSRFRYTGQILLPGTELYHYKARVYHPKLGRFMQTDPIGYKDGMNWYAYVGNDPVNLVDPLGLCKKLPSGNTIGCIGVTFFGDVSDLNSGSAGSAQRGQSLEEYMQEKFGQLTITAEERGFAEVGDRKAFWTSRMGRGDPIANIALGIVNNESFFGHKYVGGRLANMLTGLQGDALNALGVDLMRAHIGAVDFDFNNEIGIPGLLSPTQAAAYHHEVFSTHGLGKWQFGGTLFNTSPNLMRAIWCTGCDHTGADIR